MKTPLDQLADPNFVPTSAFWMPSTALQGTVPDGFAEGWVIGYKDITASTNERTMIAAVLPHPSSNFTIRCAFVRPLGTQRIPCLLANLNALVFDYLVRQSLGGLHLSDYLVRQLPILQPRAYTPADVSFTATRVLELSYTSWDMRRFAEDCGYRGPPFRWDETRRFVLSCELDALFFHLYRVRRDDVDYIIEAFPIVRRHDKERVGEYRTKRVILKIYDEMEHARETTEPYQTQLDPPPADPHVAHATR